MLITGSVGTSTTCDLPVECGSGSEWFQLILPNDSMGKYFYDLLVLVF
jgi:hypothetical protein